MQEYYSKLGVCYDHKEYEKIFLVYTYKCNASCLHCLTESNPTKQEKIPLEIAMQIVELGAKAGKKFLVVSGGEPMLYYDELLQLFARSHELGYFICLNSNGFWAKTTDAAVKKLQPLVALGLRALFPTATAFHAKFVPTECVANAREACRVLGIECEVNFYPSTWKTEDSKIFNLLDLDESVWYTDGLIKTGNDVSSLEQTYRYLRPGEMDDCGSVHLGVNPHLDVIANCNMSYSCAEFRGTPLYRGNLRERSFVDILNDEREDPLLQFLYRNHVNRIHTLLESDYEAGQYYKKTYSDQRYHSVTEYYLAIFKDDRILSALKHCVRVPGLRP